MNEAANPKPKRRRFGRFLLILFILLIAAGTAWFFLTRSSDEELFEAIPSDAVYVIETNNLSKGWLTLSSSKQWKHLLSNEYFAFVHEDAMWMDSLIRGNRMLGRLMENRPMLVSAHMLPGDDYDFLFVVDLKSAARFSVLTDIISGSLRLGGTEIRKRAFEGSEIIEIHEKGNDDILFLSLSKNRLLASYSSEILQSAITRISLGNLAEDQSFVALRDRLDQGTLFRFYFNYKMLSPYLRVFFEKPEPMADAAGEVLKYSGFNVKLKDERLRLDGFTLTDSLASYVRALSMVKPGRSELESVLSERTALYLGMGFDSYPEFFNAFRQEIGREDSAALKAYDKNIDRLRKFFRIDLEKDFFSWIGNEIAYVKMQPSADIKENDFVVALHASDIGDAKNGMGEIVRKISNRTPWKVKDFTYGEHEIRYFKMKGFFKLFFGKLFERLEEPYFIFLGDYVLFSNSPSSLIDIIDDYTQGRTLERDQVFMNFRDEFNPKANVNLFLRTPKVYSHLLYFSSKEKKEGVEKNKSLILSYSRLGMQLVSDNGEFRTQLLADHEEETAIEAEWEELESSAEELFNEEYELLSFKPELQAEDMAVDGFVRKLHEDGGLRFEGLVMSGKPSGLWRSYHPSGNLASAVTYMEGSAHGVALFYYDDIQTLKKAEVLYDMDRISGAYREFYRNGNSKAVIEYRDGLPDGDAEFYYESGAIKARGKYRKGERDGRWKYYSEAGNVIEGERM